MKYWITKEGDKLKLTDMGTEHILNCIGMLQKRFNEDGKAIAYREYGGMGADNMDIWYEVEEIDVTRKTKNAIKSFKDELKKRGI